MDISNGYLVLDVETTGLDPFDDRIVEIAVGLALPPIDGEPGPGLRVQSWLIRDWAEFITPESTAIHGIDQWEASRLGIPMTQAIDAIERAALDNLPIVAHNGLKFDLPFIDRAYSLVTGSAALAIPNRWIDTAALFKGFMVGEAPKPGESHQAYAHRILGERHYGVRFSLAAACQRFGFEINPDEPRHRAGTDVKYTAKVFECLLSQGVTLGECSNDHIATNSSSTNSPQKGAWARRLSRRSAQNRFRGYRHTGGVGSPSHRG